MKTCEDVGATLSYKIHVKSSLHNFEYTKRKTSKSISNIHVKSCTVIKIS